MGGCRAGGGRAIQSRLNGGRTEWHTFRQSDHWIVPICRPNPRNPNSPGHWFFLLFSRIPPSDHNERIFSLEPCLKKRKVDENKEVSNPKPYEPLPEPPPPTAFNTVVQILEPPQVIQVFVPSFSVIPAKKYGPQFFTDLRLVFCHCL